MLPNRIIAIDTDNVIDIDIDIENLTTDSSESLQYLLRKSADIRPNANAD